MTNEEYQNLLHIDRELYKRSYYDFFIRAFEELHPGETYTDNWHVKYLCDILQQRAQIMFEGEPGTNLIINIPPRSLKSMMCTVIFPAWLWSINPSIKFIGSSYAKELSTEHCVKTRRLVESDWYKSLYGDDIHMTPDQNLKTSFENTKGGTRKAVSTGGAITGSGGDIIVVDDPVNPLEAESEADRTTANEHFDMTLSTRLNNPDKGFFVIVMQRLHEEDLTGHCLRKDGQDWQHIKIPASGASEAIPKELSKYYKDDLMFPSRFSEAYLTRQKKNMGSYGYSGQFDQEPAPKGGAIWQKWFKPIPDDEMDQMIPRLQRIGTDWDLAYTSKDENSQSAYISAGWYNEKMYIFDLGFKSLEFPDLIKWMSLRRPTHYVEAKASGKSAVQTLRSKGINAVEVTPTNGDKVARANNVTPYAEAGRIYVRKSLLEPLYSDTKQGILKFPKGSHDDLADALAQAVYRILGKRQMVAV